MTHTMKARPTTYKGIQMRSRLEAGFAQWLDGWGFQWEYEPRCFAHERGQYLPDFMIKNLHVLGGRVDCYVECKPPLHSDGSDQALEREVKWRQERLGEARIILDSEPDALYLVITAPEGDGLGPFMLGCAAPMSTLMPMHWCAIPHGTLGLAWPPIAVPCRPWPDGYWKAT